jgi:hypothetical protein
MYLIIDLQTTNISYKTCGYENIHHSAVFTISSSGYSALTDIQQAATNIVLAV